MAPSPQTTPCERNRIGEGWPLFRIPRRQANRHGVPGAQTVCHQRHERAQSQKSRGRPSNRRVAPLSLRFPPQMRTRFFTGDFHPPTSHKPGQDVQRPVVDRRRQKGWRIVLALRVAPQYPANQDRLASGFLPHAGLRIDLTFPSRPAIPMLDFQCRPRCVGISKTVLRRGTTSSFDAWSPSLAGLAFWSWIPQLGLQAQAGNQTRIG